MRYYTPHFKGEEFVKTRKSEDGYFNMLTVRHPLARIYSAWHDKFRNGHSWYTYIRRKYGKYLGMLETIDMQNEPYV